jgi:hypothetical protein
MTVEHRTGCGPDPTASFGADGGTHQVPDSSITTGCFAEAHFQLKQPALAVLRSGSPLRDDVIARSKPATHVRVKTGH